MQKRHEQTTQFELLEQPEKKPNNQNEPEILGEELPGESDVGDRSPQQERQKLTGQMDKAEELDPIAVIDEANIADPLSREELQAHVDRLSALSDEAVIKASIERGRNPQAGIEIRDLLKRAYEVEIRLDEQKERTKELAPVVDDILRAVGSDRFSGKTYSAERDVNNGRLKLTRRVDEIAIMEAKPTADGWLSILPQQISQDYKEFLTLDDVTKVKEARERLQKLQKIQASNPVKRQESQRE